MKWHRAVLIASLLAFGLAGAARILAQQPSPEHADRDPRAWDAVPGDSLFQLPVTLQSADGTEFNLADLRGQPLVVTMFYSHCTSVCPLVTAELQRLLASLSPAERQQIRVLMVSFDSLRDSPEALRAFKTEHHIQEPNWIIARASAGDVRLLSAAFGIRYRELPDHTFNHSATILLTDRDGTERARTSELTAPDAAFVNAVRAQIAARASKP